MINDYSLSKVFYENLYKAFIFYVKHLRKMFNQAFVNIKSYEFNLKFWRENGWSHRKQNRSRVTSGEGRFYKRCSWERITILVLESVSTENEAKELLELAPKKVILGRKAKNQKLINIEEIIFHLKSQYSEYNLQDRTFIPNIPSQENMPSFEAITGNLQTVSKSINENENMGLKNKSLFGGWLLVATNIYRRQNLSCRFEDWLYERCRIKR